MNKFIDDVTKQNLAMKHYYYTVINCRHVHPCMIPKPRTIQQVKDINLLHAYYDQYKHLWLYSICILSSSHGDLR